ncbi:MAG: class A beta-lactamase-related serine hydrolase [Chloroflexi bacterium]|nr:class A beta-lactamase-related serine hydrolase [Chloroflexota bacterium]
MPIVSAIQSASTLALQEAIAQFGEIGLQVAVIHRGALVVDAVAGIADLITGRPVDHDTLFLVFSNSKGVTATVVHRLVERGEMAYDAPLARYWPEFAKHGKGNVTVRHALSHRAGLPEFRNVPVADYPSLFRTGRHLEDATPDWAPGASMAYHSMTFGTLLGRAVEGATGMPFGDVMRAEVAHPLGLQDIWFGVPADDSVTRRIATLEAAHDPDPSTGLGPMTHAEHADRAQSALDFNTTEAHTGCMPAAGLITNARTLVRHYGAMREGGLDGVQLLNPSTIAQATVPYSGADGAHVAWTTRMGLGYALGAATHPFCGFPTVAPWPDAFGHTGLGGSISTYCPSHDLAVVMTKNALAPSRFSFRAWDHVLRAIAGALGLDYDG